MEIKNKVAIVTGASSGIGLATARLLSQKGAKVALIARTTSKIEKLAKELVCSLAITADMSKEKDVKDMIRKLLDHYSRIDILINNAGRGYDAPLEKINTRTFRGLFELDVVGPLVAMQHVIPIMRKQKEGAIINISSGTALMFLPNMSAYSSLKRALVGLSLTAREELKKDHIIVSVVYPYITLTDFEENTIKELETEIEEEGEGPFYPPDKPEHVAQKIIDAIKTEKAEIYAHDWMRTYVELT